MTTSTTVYNSPLSNYQVADRKIDGKAFQLMGNGLVPEAYDELALSYTGVNLTGVVYKLVGVTVATLTLGYTGTDLTSVVRT